MTFLPISQFDSVSEAGTDTGTVSPQTASKSWGSESHSGEWEGSHPLSSSCLLWLDWAEPTTESPQTLLYRSIYDDFFMKKNIDEF